MEINEIKSKLEKALPPKRFKHSLNVMQTSIELAKVYGEDAHKSAIAGLLHDCGRMFNNEEAVKACEKYNVIVNEISIRQPILLHGALGAEIAKSEYLICDSSILDAIRYHTTGRANMALLEKIVYLADYIEPDRSFSGVDEARKEALIDIDKAMLLALDKTIKHIIKKGLLLDSDTIIARNYIVEVLNRR